jgi:hypothetical protein
MDWLTRRRNKNRNINRNRNRNRNNNNGFTPNRTPMRNYSSILNKTRNNALSRRRNQQVQFFRNRKLKENQYVENLKVNTSLTRKANQRSPINQDFFDLTLYQKGPLTDTQVRELGILRSLVKDIQTGRLRKEDIDELKRLATFSKSEKDPAKLAAISDRLKSILKGTNLLGLIGASTGLLLIGVGAIMSSGILFAVGPVLTVGGSSIVFFVNRYTDKYIGNPNNLNKTRQEVEIITLSADELIQEIDKLLVKQPMNQSYGLRPSRKQSFEPIAKNPAKNLSF